MYLEPNIYRLYVGADGSYDARINNVRPPEGTFRTMIIGIDYGNTNIGEVFDAYLVGAQRRINEDYAAYAAATG